MEKPRRLPLRLDPVRLRFWAVVLPIHVGAFATLYFGTYRLLEYAYSHAGAAAARDQLNQAVHEMPFLMPPAGDGRSHVFAHLLTLHQRIALRLYDGSGAVIGPPSPLPDVDELLRVRRLLGDPARENEVWVQKDRKQQWVRGVVRLGGGTAGCSPCHAANTTLGAAAMKIDFTEELAGIRGLLRWRVGVLLVLWVTAVAGMAIAVQLTLRRSLARLERDVAAATAGKDSGDTPVDLPFDPAMARLYERLRDLLRRQRAREAEVASRLAHVDQLASLGQLAAGLAHEIKNPLAGLQGALEVLKSETYEPTTANLYDEMLGELARVNGILRRLLESGRPAPLRLARTDLTRLVSETVDLMEPALRRKKVTLAAEVPEGLPAVRLDPAKIRQVLVNLVQNAGEAMGEGGGRVTVRATTVPQGDVVLAVEDDGPGIPPAEVPRLFEPFYTTKFTGTGLGLTISKSLVEQHGGRMEVDSEPGRGTTFFVFLPAPPEGSEPAEVS